MTRLAELKSPVLKKCLSPECDNYYYGYKNDRYCCPKCANRSSNLKNKEYQKQWKSEHRDHINAWQREYIKKHPEKRKIYYQNHKSKIHKYQKQYHEDNKDDINRRHRETYHKKKENGENNVRNGV